MLPVARFKCERLILVGDPKQLSPIVEGSEAEHSSGLEMTLFERLEKTGHGTTMLRTQYRCHPSIRYARLQPKGSVCSLFDFIF